MLKIKPGLWSFVLQPVDEEHFHDQEEEGEEGGAGLSSLPRPGIVSVVGGGGYLPSHRNPLYCRAEGTCLWELGRVRERGGGREGGREGPHHDMCSMISSTPQLTNHYHPSVQVFARKLTSVSEYSVV